MTQEDWTLDLGQRKVLDASIRRGEFPGAWSSIRRSKELDWTESLLGEAGEENASTGRRSFPIRAICLMYQKKSFRICYGTGHFIRVGSVVRE